MTQEAIHKTCIKEGYRFVGTTPDSFLFTYDKENKTCNIIISKHGFKTVMTVSGYKNSIFDGYIKQMKHLRALCQLLREQ